MSKETLKQLVVEKLLGTPDPRIRNFLIKYLHQLEFFTELETAQLSLLLQGSLNGLNHEDFQMQVSFYCKINKIKNLEELEVDQIVQQDLRNPSIFNFHKIKFLVLCVVTRKVSRVAQKKSVKSVRHQLLQYVLQQGRGLAKEFLENLENFF